MSNEEANLREIGGDGNQLQNNAASPLTNSSHDLELCKYVYFKSLYANGSTREALEQLSSFVNENLREELAQLQRYQQFQQQQQQMAMGQPSAVPIASCMNPAGGVNLVQQQQQMLQQQFPQVFQLLNSRDLQKRRVELETQLSKCYLKLGQWRYDLDGFGASTIDSIIQHYELAKNHDQESYKAWQAWAYANYEAIQLYRQPAVISSALSDHATPEEAFLAQQQQQQQQTRQMSMYVRPAIEGFFTCIKLSSASVAREADCLQDTLCLLTLWFKYCETEEVHEALSEGIRRTPIEIWLQVIPQLIARIDTRKVYVARLIHNLLMEIGRVHPQALVYRLILASKFGNVNNGGAAAAGGPPPANGGGGATTAQAGGGQTARNLAAMRILQSLRESNNSLVEQAKLVSEELIRVALVFFYKSA